jgi:hypothetical protein
MATGEELNWLKEEWQRSPSFNLEDAPGFENHQDELRAWRLAFEAASEEFENQQLVKRALDHGRTAEQQEERERAIIDERRHRNAASHTLRELFSAAGLRWFGPGPIDLDDALDSLIDDLVRAAEARVRTTRLSCGS